jgi:hypothetical protein
MSKINLRHKICVICEKRLDKQHRDLSQQVKDENLKISLEAFFNKSLNIYDWVFF